ncbi:MAG: hypothetical protein ACD_23C00315G0002 [uncultured bacterium]|nr:MAG: hypothetical protein ACD_23C00315G0002 [uncultured bacterium]
MKYPFSIDCCTLEAFDTLDSKGNIEHGYDIIILSGVLEHLANPADNLKLLHYYLAANGKLIIQVPNEDPGSNAKFFERVNYAHIIYFTACSLTEMCRLAGFEVEKVHRPNGKTIVAILRRAMVARPNYLTAFEFYYLYLKYSINVEITSRYIKYKRALGSWLAQ